MEPEVAVVFWTVVALRFLVPLLIPLFPLPAIIACLIIDGVDQTVFQSFGFDPPGYQGYDKAMDVYYLCIAYMSTLRNWTSLTALRISRFLFFYRLIGVLAFELLQIRALLLVFPNTFEYFFIAYEAVRSRWNPAAMSNRFWLLAMAGIWIFVKLPQEYWIHVAQMDVTDTLRDVPWAAPALVAAILGLLAAFWFGVKPRLAAPDWGWRIPADPIPASVNSAEARAGWLKAHGAIRSIDTVEKAVLIGLLSVIFAQMLPDLKTSDLRLFSSLAILVVVNVAWSLFLARHSVTVEAAWAVAAGRLAFNLGFVWVAHWLLDRNGGSLNVTATVFFLALLSLVITLHDRWRPVAGARFGAEEARRWWVLTAPESANVGMGPGADEASPATGSAGRPG